MRQLALAYVNQFLRESLPGGHRSIANGLHRLRANDGTTWQSGGDEQRTGGIDMRSIQIH